MLKLFSDDRVEIYIKRLPVLSFFLLPLPLVWNETWILSTCDFENCYDHQST